jgi:hypothetical protein
MSDWIIRWRERLPDHESLGRHLAMLFLFAFAGLAAVGVQIGGAMGLTAAVLFTVFAGVGVLAYLVQRAKV